MKEEMGNKMNLFKDLYRQMKEMGDTNGCAPLAVAAATGVDYETAYKQFVSVGRYKRKYSSIEMIVEAMEGMGYRLQKMAVQYFHAKYPKSAPKGKSITPKQITKYPEAFKGATYMVLVRGHIFTVKNAEIIDRLENRSYRSIKIFRVEKMGNDK